MFCKLNSLLSLSSFFLLCRLLKSSQAQLFTLVSHFACWALLSTEKKDSTLRALHTCVMLMLDSIRAGSSKAKGCFPVIRSVINVQQLHHHTLLPLIAMHVGQLTTGDAGFFITAAASPIFNLHHIFFLVLDSIFTMSCLQTPPCYVCKTGKGCDVF